MSLTCNVWRLLSMLIIGGVLVSSKAPQVKHASFTYHNGMFKFNSDPTMRWTCQSNFNDTIHQDGWSYLEIETNGDFPDFDQANCAGYAEGYSTKEIIYNSWKNSIEGYCERKGEKFCDVLRDFIAKNVAWMKKMIKQEADNSPLWHAVDLILHQVEGLADGYNEIQTNPIPREDIIAMNLFGDLEDLETALNPDLHNMTPDEWMNSETVRGDGHCSALIKLLPGNRDLYVSHVTWNTYQSMLRVQKKFMFHFHQTATSRDVIPGNTLSYTSYPGVLHSGDDFYTLSSGLVTLETTIGNSNPALWSYVSPEGELLEWIRVMVANRLATNGKDWTDIFSRYNSGTYNNQWMVVDYNLFNPGQKIRENTLWVLEQLPGHIHAEDMSGLLKSQGYWPSYNVPYFPDIFNLSGNPALVEKYGDWFSYDRSPRALIFKRDHNKVEDLDSMMSLMRYNDFKNDPLSICNCTPPYSAENAISARNDMNPKNGTYPFGALGHRSHGGTDAKITSAGMVKSLEFLAVNGPTYDQQPVFKWSDQDFVNDVPHHGHPNEWKFPVQKHKWEWPEVSRNQ